MKGIALLHNPFPTMHIFYTHTRTHTHTHAHTCTYHTHSTPCLPVGPKGTCCQHYIMLNGWGHEEYLLCRGNCVCGSNTEGADQGKNIGVPGHRK